VNPVVDKVARAIWASSPGCSGEGLPTVHEKNYQRMARAAIEALGLTEMVKGLDHL
jgi:hypothetical protein